MALTATLDHEPPQIPYSMRLFERVQISAMMVGGIIVGRLLGWPKMDSIFLGCMISVSSTTIIIIGGIGNLAGAMAAGVMLGVAESMTAFYWAPKWAPVISVAPSRVRMRPAKRFGS